MSFYIRLNKSVMTFDGLISAYVCFFKVARSARKEGATCRPQKWGAAQERGEGRGEGRQGEERIGDGRRGEERGGEVLG